MQEVRYHMNGRIYRPARTKVRECSFPKVEVEEGLNIR